MNIDLTKAIAAINEAMGDMERDERIKYLVRLNTEIMMHDKDIIAEFVHGMCDYMGDDTPLATEDKMTDYEFIDFMQELVMAPDSVIKKEHMKRMLAIVGSLQLYKHATQNEESARQRRINELEAVLDRIAKSGGINTEFSQFDVGDVDGPAMSHARKIAKETLKKEMHNDGGAKRRLPKGV